ncbi:ethanolamine ammonia-lyase [Sphingomonas oleivorans]|uniref:Ethanolamine ammonia-lyase small subunit n=1 Tax=Sphingomonas oleivorans TaxID=1735121 RepID=A0A2T5G238_9SPHN|nr:ethanolamine ammonia-lyase subunit EutC [Sphingomonas oleivorans]PTQ13223.1 ethanolamine ammonia-lyase [Sphingomonas oleivorans]
MSAVADPSPFGRLRGATQARIGLGRAGNGLPTVPLLDFQLAHARARDAVHAALDIDLLTRQLEGRQTIAVDSSAGDRATFLQRPDLGRRLDPASAAHLARGEYDAVFILADGLSATAVHAHGAALIGAMAERLAGWRIAPVVLARQARVALGDDIGAALGAAQAVVLIGERPGLSAADSLGAYLTWDPRPGRRDSERNCISNIRPPYGLSHAAAADQLAWLMKEARKRRLSGVALKDEHAGASPILTLDDGRE